MKIIKRLMRWLYTSGQPGRKWWTFFWRNFCFLWFAECKRPLGLPPHAKITASNQHSYKHGSSCLAEYGHIMSNKAWCPRRHDGKWDKNWFKKSLNPMFMMIMYFWIQYFTYKCLTTPYAVSNKVRWKQQCLGWCSCRNDGKWNENWFYKLL